MSEWRDNPGRMPGLCAGKRVEVELRNGSKPKESWPADGKGGCRWSLEGHAFDIVRFRIV